MEAKLPTIWKDEKGTARKKLGRGESQKGENKMEKIRNEEFQTREAAGARKGREVAKHCVFPMICGSGGSKSRLAKAAGAEPARQMEDENFHTIVAQSTF